MKKFSEWLDGKKLAGSFIAGPVGYHMANSIGAKDKKPVIRPNFDKIKSDFSAAEEEAKQQDLLRKQIEEEFKSLGYKGIDLMNRVNERLMEIMKAKKRRNWQDWFRK